MEQIKSNVYYSGKIDWELRKFHGEEYSTHKGSSYNSYLIKEEKIVLIDTVWKPFSEEFITNLKNEIDINKIDYIVINHGEIDHSGALPELMKLIPNTPIYCTANAIKSLTGHYHQNWNFNVVKTGDKLNIGNGKELIFIEAAMLHWPDTMFSYLTKDNILFSTDAFGQHLATELIFNDMVDQADLFYEATKYYANILTPFNKLVYKKIQDILAMNLEIDVICPSHGVIWRKNPKQIIDKYIQWSSDFQENQITIVYDSMWSGTRAMAEQIAKGIKENDNIVTIKIFNIATADKNDIVTEIFKSKFLALGSPTINRGILSGMAGLLEEIKGLAFKNKKAVSFGCYGWSGESVSILNKGLTESGFLLIDEGLKTLWNPNEESLSLCKELGKKIAKSA